MVNYGFSAKRAELYQQALQEYPAARQHDIARMDELLDPQPDEVIVLIGTGSGFFVPAIAAKTKQVIVVDPSEFQLACVEGLGLENVTVHQARAESFFIRPKTIDKVWSFGAMHHCTNKVEAFKKFHKVLKPGGKVIMCDVWQGTRLAQFFDACVARFCLDGHEVAFWSNEFAMSVCIVAGFEEVGIQRLEQRWQFSTEADIASFLCKLHGLNGLTEQKCLDMIKKYLDTDIYGDGVCLFWPMKVLIAQKSYNQNE